MSDYFTIRKGDTLYLCNDTGEGLQLVAWTPIMADRWKRYRNPTRWILDSFHHKVLNRKNLPHNQEDQSQEWVTAVLLMSDTEID